MLKRCLGLDVFDFFILDSHDDSHANHSTAIRSLRSKTGQRIQSVINIPRRSFQAYFRSKAAFLRKKPHLADRLKSQHAIEQDMSKAIMTGLGLDVGCESNILAGDVFQEHARLSSDYTLYENISFRFYYEHNSSTIALGPFHEV
jgi:hypothetical protein